MESAAQKPGFSQNPGFSFPGLTPASDGPVPHTYCRVNVLGRVTGNANVFRGVHDGAAVRITHVFRGVALFSFFPTKVAEKSEMRYACSSELVNQALQPLAGR